MSWLANYLQHFRSGTKDYGFANPTTDALKNSGRQKFSRKITLAIQPIIEELEPRILLSSLTAPTDVTATYATIPDEVVVAWKTVSGATSYNVWRNTTNSTGTATKIISGLTGTSYTDSTASTATVDYYWVTASNSNPAQTSAYSSSAEGLAELPAPGSLAATNNLTNEVLVTWNTVAGTTRYSVFRNTSNTLGTATDIDADDTSTSYADTSATPGTTYYYWVEADNALQTGAAAGSVSGEITILATPGSVTATDATIPNEVLIGWNAVSGATSYNVWRNTSNNTGTATKIATGQTGTSYTDTTVSTTTIDYYWVTASNATQTSGYGGPAEGLAELPAPGNLAATNNLTNEVLVTWNAVTGATSYTVWRNLSNTTGSATKIGGGVTGTSYADSTASTATTYYYWVTANNSLQTGVAAGPVTGESVILTAPTGVQASYATIPNEVLVAWNTISGATSYNVWRNTTNSTGTATKIASGLTGTSYTDSTASTTTVDYYWVTASNATQTSVYSSSAEGLAELPAPGSLAATTNSDINIMVTWNTVAGATGYSVFRNTSNTLGTATDIAPDDASTSYVDTSATPGSTYYYWVEAVNALQTGAAAGSVNGEMTALATPGGVTATYATILNEVQVGWNTVSDATSYNVWRNTSNNTATATEIATGQTGTSYTDSTASPATVDYYWVTASNATQTSGYGGPADGLAGLSAPGGLTASSNLTNEVLIKWSAVAGATSYSVFQNTGNSLGTATDIAADVISTSYANTSATPGKTYYYWVEADNSLQTSTAAGSATGVAQAQTPTLSTPTGITATYATVLNAVQVAWNAVSGATSYAVWRSTTDNTGTASKVASGLAVTSYTDSTASTTTVDYYWVTASNATQASGYGGPAEGLAELGAPGDLAATTNLGNEVKVTWNSVTGATTGYHVFRNTSNNLGTATEIDADDTSTSYLDTSASIGTTYYYWVEGYNTLQTGTAAAPATGVAQAETLSSLSTPTGVTATYATILNEVQLGWNAVNGALFYNVWRSTTNNSSTATKIASGLTGTSYIDPTASTSTVDYYWITAVNGSLTSGYGGPADGLAELSAPSGVTATSNLDEEVEVTWNAVSGAATYNIWRNTSNSTGSATEIATGQTGTSYADMTASTTGDDYYWVTASNSLQTSNYGGSAEGYALLSPPGNLSATFGPTYPVQISWNAVGGATAYRVFRNTTNNFGSATDIDPDDIGTSYADSAVSYETPYYYWVESYNAFQTSVAAGPATGESTVLSAPGDVTATYATLPDEVQVSWNSVVDATSYNIWRNTSNNTGTATEIATGQTGTTYEDTTASTSTVDYYWVTASNANPAQTSGYGGPAEGLAQLPATSYLAATSSGAYQVVVTWNAVAGATGYNVFRSTGNTFGSATDIAPDVIPVTGVTGTAYADTTATVGTTYYYWVQAVNTLQPTSGAIAGPAAGVAQYSTTYYVDQIRQAYQFDLLTFTNSLGQTVDADGAGQTIAIIDADYDPTIFTDVDTFDQLMTWNNSPETLYDQFGAASSFLTQVTLPGVTTPSAVGNGWAQETSLDVEWAHAIAPAAQILLVEAPDPDLYAAVAYAETYTSTSITNVNVISMSFGGAELAGEGSYYNSLFTTPSGQPGITFVASAGDNGGIISYPAVSPNVLSVGGTSLLTSAGTYNYVSESAWGDGTYGDPGGGGGLSQYESQPAYQSGVEPGVTQLASPDVSYDSDPNTGFWIADGSYANGSGEPWYAIGGTSDAAPQWAALIAIADQGRQIAGETSLDGPSQVLPGLFALYNTPAYASDFNDVTSGSNGHNAGPGFDLATGLGTPIANNLIPYLVSLPNYTPAISSASNSNLPNITPSAPLSLFNPGGIPIVSLSSSDAPGSGNAIDLIQSNYAIKTIKTTNPSGAGQLYHLAAPANTTTPGIINGLQLSTMFNPLDQLNLGSVIG
jgi:hypothetical protein